MTARQQIAAIDRQIDGIRKELLRRTSVRLFDAGSWQIAWDRNPDLRERNAALYCQRGELQVLRDAADHKTYLATQRRERKATKARYANCPTCGTLAFQVAA